MSTTTTSLRATRAGLRPQQLPPVFPFAWAVAHGQDRFGLWQAFALNGVRQRLRWVSPGAFMMGSPGAENMREDDETPHKVRLTQGCWLADTTCTQALSPTYPRTLSARIFPSTPSFVIANIVEPDPDIKAPRHSPCLNSQVFKLGNSRYFSNTGRSRSFTNSPQGVICGAYSTPGTS